MAVIEELRDFVNSEIHPLLSPDNYWAYCRLIDMIDEVEKEYRKEKENG